MTRDNSIRLALQAGFDVNDYGEWVGDKDGKCLDRFAALVAAAEREKVAAWMIDHDYATGHGDTIEDLLKELVWQIRVRARDAV
jgi:hypothetical protein